MAWTARSIDNGTESAESVFGTGLRTAARSAARVGETVAGLPADIIAGGLQLSDIAGKKLGELTDIEKLKRSDTSALRQYLPTSENIQKYITGTVEKGLPEGYLSPHTQGEERLDSFVESMASLLSFGGPAAKGASFINKAAKSAGLAGGAELGKWAMEEITGSPEIGGAVKVGTLLAGSLLGGRRQLTQQATDLFNKTDAIAADTSKKISIKNTLQKEAKSVIKSLGGIESPSKSIVKKLGSDILNAASKTDTMSLKDLVDADRVWNEIIRTNKDALTANPSSFKKIYDIKKGIKEAIQSTKDIYPEFYTSYTKAKDIYSGLHASDAISKGLESVAKGEHFKSPITTYFILKNPSKITTYGAATLGASFLKAPYNFIKSLSASPYIRTHYTNMLKSAAHGKLAIALKELHKIDDALAEQDLIQTSGWRKR